MKKFVDEKTCEDVEIFSNNIHSIDLTLKYKFLNEFKYYIISSGLIGGYILCYTNQTAQAINVKFNLLHDISKQDYYQSIIGSSGVLGALIGSLIAGSLINHGRKLTITIAIYIGIFGVLISCILDIYCIIFGRLLYGISCGLINVALPRLIYETIPSNIVDGYGSLYPFSFTISSLIAFTSGTLLPDDKDHAALQNDEMWRFIYFFPIFFYLVLWYYNKWKITFDSPKFLVIKNRLGEALIMLKLMYLTDEGALHELQRLRQEAQNEQSQLIVSLRQAFTDKKYSSASKVSIIYIILHEFTGVNAINMYSKMMFIKQEAKGEQYFSPSAGVIILGVFNFVFGLMSIHVVKFFKKRFLLIWGHLFMGFSLFLMAFSAANQHNDLLLVSILLFFLGYQFSTGPLAWMYIAEIAVDSVLSLSYSVLWASILVIGMSTTFMMDSPLQIQGFFLIYALIQVCTVIYCYFEVKETSGLTEQQKKSLYDQTNL